MTCNNRKKLFKTYYETHAKFLDSDDRSKLNWFLEYVKINYLKHIRKYNRASTKVLEIGCGRGYLLSSLSSLGFERLYGIDLSPDDVKQAKVLVPKANIICADASEYLNTNEEQFDIVILKAVLEHLKKEDVIPLLKKVKNGLKSGGTVIVDVPNMDWFFAQHERYMDFTHEVGFTKESLRQVMSNVFASVKIIPIDNIFSSSVSKFKKQFSRFILGTLLAWADPEGASNPIWARSIVGIGKNELDLFYEG